MLFVIAKEFHKWQNANEKIFSNPVMKNSICSFHGQSREKLKWWLTFKKYNEQMVSDTQKFYFCSSSNLHLVLFRQLLGRYYFPPIRLYRQQCSVNQGWLPFTDNRDWKVNYRMVGTHTLWVMSSTSILPSKRSFTIWTFFEH